MTVRLILPRHCPAHRRQSIIEGLRNMPFAPSAQMQHVPYDVDDDEGDSDSDLDVRISGASESDSEMRHTH